MGADDLASDARKEDNQKIREHATWEAERGQKGQGTTDQFQCAKCRQRKCTYYVRWPLPCRRLERFPDCAAVCLKCGLLLVYLPLHCAWSCVIYLHLTRLRFLFAANADTVSR
jgi:hypothetical protein